MMVYYAEIDASKYREKRWSKLSPKAKYLNQTWTSSCPVQQRNWNERYRDWVIPTSSPVDVAGQTVRRKRESASGTMLAITFAISNISKVELTPLLAPFPFPAHKLDQYKKEVSTPKRSASFMQFMKIHAVAGFCGGVGMRDP